ncbi:MAG: tetratricopeptide repeat protein, partial [Rhodanobacteraceae bacterium]
YKEGMLAYTRKDYKHAIHMLEVAASWAYKPAEYNLGVMYFQGLGVPKDRPLGAAWLVLAAERGNPQYVAARDVVITSMSDAQFAQTDELWGQLKQTYGDKVALRRAKAQWAYVKANQTGTRVGGTVGELRVGTTNPHGQFKTAMTSNSGSSSVIQFGTTSWLNVLTGGSTDGSVAYNQFRHSDNPYDPIFLKNRSGTATVEPLQVVRGKGSQSGSSDSNRKPKKPDPIPSSN